MVAATMGDTTVKLNVNLPALKGKLTAAMRAVVQQVTLGLAAAPGCPDGIIDLDDIVFGMCFGKHPVSSTETRDEFATWLLGIGLRDAIEALENFLGEVQCVAALYRSHTTGIRAEESGTVEEVVRAFWSREFGKFGEKNWKDKILAFQNEFGREPEFAREVLSIQAVRNCLTHRRGLVGERDVKDKADRRLVLHYRCMQVIAKSPEGQVYAATPGTVVHKGHSVGVRTGVEQSKSFALGQKIELTAQEFTWITYTLWLFGATLIDGLAAYGRQLVIPDDPDKCDSP